MLILKLFRYFRYLINFSSVKLMLFSQFQQKDPKLPFVGSSFNKLVFVGEKYKAYAPPRDGLLLFERCRAEGELSLWLMKVFSVANRKYHLTVIPEIVQHLINVKVQIHFFFIFIQFFRISFSKFGCRAFDQM